MKLAALAAIGLASASASVSAAPIGSTDYPEIPIFTAQNFTSTLNTSTNGVLQKVEVPNASGNADDVPQQSLLVMHLYGTPEEMGRAHGESLGCAWCFYCVCCVGSVPCFAFVLGGFSLFLSRCNPLPLLIKPQPLTFSVPKSSFHPHLGRLLGPVAAEFLTEKMPDFFKEEVAQIDTSGMPKWLKDIIENVIEPVSPDVFEIALSYVYSVQKTYLEASPSKILDELAGARRIVLALCLPLLARNIGS